MKFGDLSLSTELSYSMKTLPAKFASPPCTSFELKCTWSGRTHLKMGQNPIYHMRVLENIGLCLALT